MLTVEPVDTGSPVDRPVDAKVDGPISLRAYARHRGVSGEAVSRAVKGGRLRASVVRIDGVPKISDVAIADREWTGNTDLTKAPASVKERADGRAASRPPAPPPAAPAPRQAAQKTSSAPTPPSGNEDDEGILPGTLTDATIIEKHWSAKKKELEYLVAAGELVNAREVTQRLAEVFTTCRTKILAIPSKAKAEIPELTPTAIGRLDAIIREALDDLAATPITSAPGGVEAAIQ